MAELTDIREAGCIAGALTGLTRIDIDETHRVHEHASSAIVRARTPEH